MPIHLVTGPANSGKARVLMAELRARAARGEQPLLIVPTRADQARYRRELVEHSPAPAARIERFDGLLAELLERAPGGRPQLSSLARERVLAGVSGASPGLVRALARAIADLEAQRVTPARLRGALRAWVAAEATRSDQLALFERDLGESSSLQWLAGVYERYQQQLAALRRCDRELGALAALDKLRRSPALWGGRALSLYGFDDLTELQLDAIETLGAVVDADVTVSLTYEPARTVFAGRAGAFQRLLPLADRHTQLQARSDHYAAGARSPLHHLERSLFAEPPGERIACEGAVRLLEGGSPRAELELLAAEVAALLAEGVPAQEVAIVHRSPHAIAPLLGEVLARSGVPYAMRRRLAFADTAVGRALIGALRCALGAGALGDLLAWLRAPGVLQRPQLADRLEARAVRAGALSAEGARAIWETEQWPLERIERLRQAAARGAAALAGALIGELERLFTAPRRGRAPVLAEHELQEAAALAAGRRALEDLGELFALAPASDLLSPEYVLQTLEQLELRVGERSAAGRVAVVDPLGLRARRVRMLFVCGMQEGVFPAPPAPPLIAEEQRRALAQASGRLALRPAPDRLAAERYLLYALLSRPLERLTLSWHAADEDGLPTPRSLFVDDVCDLFEPIAVRTAPALALAGENPRGLAAGAPEPPIKPLRDERVLAQLRERRLWSASSLELWAGCPVRWFVERQLAAEQLGPDGEPLVRGSLAHAALKATFEHLRERTGSARLGARSLVLAKQLLRDALAELDGQYRLSAAAERVPGARLRLRRDLERYLEHSAERGSTFEPTYLELEFGFVDADADADPPTPPALAIGEQISVRGRIDRIDLDGDGAAVVYDYKGRSAPPAARWLQDRSWQVALYMRAVQQALGRRVVGGFYQPLAGGELAARGALDSDAEVELDSVRTDRLGHDELEELLDDCVAAARAAALQARSGALRPRPGSCAFGGGCAYPTICRCER